MKNNFVTPPVSMPGVFYWKWALASLLLICCFTGSGQPRVEVKEDKVNFGAVKRGEVIRNVYEIVNKGNQPLVLTEAEVACSCTTVEFSRQPLMPGQTTTVTVNFNTATVYGRQDRTVLLSSNDPGGPVKLRYKGTVSRD